MASIGAQMDSLGHGTARLGAQVLQGFQQQQGFAHGGLVFTLADSAAGYAALTLMPLEKEVMTGELKINYLNAAAHRLIAEGRVLKAGRRLIVVAADVWSVSPDNTRKHVAALQGTMIPVDA